ncbi:RES domain-containing protein [Streptomyces atratus]|uniref:RES domain-containing protein n=1 Tax=Streptomyces atratus TaxID=1893 RepID=UPI00364F6380
MSVFPPPPRHLGGQALQVPAGTPLHRVHHERRASTAFNPLLASPFSGGRFDATPEDPYPFLYAAFAPAVALAEAVVRTLPFSESGARIIPLAAIHGRRLSELRTTEPLALLDLTNAFALASVGASSELVMSDGGAPSRAWAALLRRDNPWAQGFVWPSRYGHPENLVVLFEDRCSSGLLAEAESSPLTPSLTNSLLESFRCAVGIPDTQEPLSVAPEKPRDVAPEVDEPPPPHAEVGDDFALFFKTHFPSVCRILNARANDWELAQDAASHAFEMALRSWPDLCEHPNPVGWVVLTGRRVVIKTQRIQAKRSAGPLGPAALDVPCEDLNPATATVEKVAVHAAIGNLTRDKRECFVMHYALQHSVAYIADVLQIPPGTVKSRLSAARKDLKDALGHDFREGGTR